MVGSVDVDKQIAAESFTSEPKGNKERDRDTRPGMGV